MDPDETTAGLASAAAGRRPLARAARVGALLVVSGFAVAFVVGDWDDIVSAFDRLRWPLVLASFAFTLGSLLSSAASWRAILAGLDSRLPVGAAARVFLLGQLGKYVPGGVWPVLAQAELSKEYGVPRTRAASATVVNMLVSLVMAVAVAAVGLAFSSADALRTYWWLVLVGVAGACTLAPPVFNWLLRTAFHLLRRPRPETVAGRDLASGAFWVLVTWLVLGTHMWLLIAALGTAEPRTWLLATGGFALAWAIGFLVVVLPAGAGAREAALALALLPVLSRADAVALALISRVLLLASDFAMAGLAVVAERRRLRGSVSPAPGSGA